MEFNLEFIFLLCLFWFSLVIIHELGHALTARLLGIKIIKIEYRLFSQSHIETEQINNLKFKKLFWFSGGFYGFLFLMALLLIFPFKTSLNIVFFEIDVNNMGIFFGVIHLTSGIIECFFHDFYMKKYKLACIYIFILSIIFYLFLHPFL